MAKYKITETVCGREALIDYTDFIGSVTKEMLEGYDYIVLGLDDVEVKIEEVK